MLISPTTPDALRESELGNTAELAAELAASEVGELATELLSAELTASLAGGLSAELTDWLELAGSTDTTTEETRQAERSRTV